MTAITSTATVPATAARTGATSRRTARLVRAASVVAATVSNSVFFAAARAAGTEFQIQNPQGEMVPFHTYEIAMVTFVIAALGWATLAMFERFTRRPRRNWIVLAGAVLALSFVPIPLSVMSDGTKVALAVIHVIVGVALAPMLRTRHSR